MFAPFALLFTLLYTVTSAHPFIQRRLPSASSCSGLELGVLDSTKNFTLAALNATLPNSNHTGAPLVLGQAGAIAGAEFEVLSTWASFPYNQWPSLSLVDGGLIANSATALTAVSTAASNGTNIGFVTTSPTPAPAQVYCVVPNAGPWGLPLLAINGHTDLFSLCSYGQSNSQNNVVYNASATDNGDGYSYDTCYRVWLQIV